VPRVTVMIPTYNGAPFIEASLRSVLAQAYEPFEVVVYDDGSDDGSADLVRARFPDPRVRVFRDGRHRGLSHARNRILRLSRGDYLAPHDSDDLMRPGRLAAQAACLASRPDVGVVFGKHHVVEEGRPGPPRAVVPTLEESGRLRRLRGAQEPTRMPLGIHPGAAMLRRSAVMTVGGYDPRWDGVEDLELLHRLWGRTRFYFLDRFEFVYQRRTEGVTGRLRAESRMERRLLGSPERRHRTGIRSPGWSVDVVADTGRPLKIIHELVAGAGADEPGPRASRHVVVEIRSRPPAQAWGDLGLDDHALVQLLHYGVSHRLTAARRLASAVIDRERSVADEILYHVGFLHPLSHALHTAGATLAHACLVARGRAGVLLMGESGCGKSTLAVAFLQHGYAYFSDEHPILALERGRVVGRSFVNRIGLTPLSLAQFPELSGAARWHTGRGKWYVDPTRVAPGRLGQACRIEALLFPRFDVRGRFRAARLSPAALLRRLLTDEYYRGLVALGDGAAAARRGHQRLSLRLAATARGFAIRYGPADIAAFPRNVERLLHRP
jgi:GT2 family glycosyltransferase